MELLKKVHNIIYPLFDTDELKLYDVEWLYENKMHILRISIGKKDRTIDLETCSMMSEKISLLLDVIPELDDKYYLEVCSPGAERELKDIDDIKNALNEYVYLKLKSPKDGLDDLTGNLIEVNENSVKIRYRVKTREKDFDVLLENIALIRLAIKF